ncbi:MAG: hypothetical protein FJ086_11325 [Deltaproteobacteria bacterium]|nr:hypothetical protein [Deltaproteobacteria bacterium]
MTALGRIPPPALLAGGGIALAAACWMTLGRSGAGGVVALLVVLALGWHVRTTAAPVLHTSLRIVERQPLGKDGEMVLLHAEGQPLLVAYGPGGIRFQRLEARAEGEVRHG